MSNRFIGMLTNVGFNFAPQGWSTCDGQLLSVAQNNALYALLGTTYGGDGVNTFGLPLLQGRRQVHRGQSGGSNNYVQGQQGGREQVSLPVGNMPAHNHTAAFTSTSTLSVQNSKGQSNIPTAGFQLGRGIDGDGTPSAVPFIYAPAATTNQVALGGLNLAGTNTVTNSQTGGTQPINLIQPYATLLTIISLEGTFPVRA